MMRALCAWLSVAVLFMAAVCTAGTNDDVSWTFENGVLNFTGTGPMPTDYPSPWSGYSSNTKIVVIGEGITTITGSAFSDFKILEEVTIPTTMTIIGQWAFSECPSLTKVTIPSAVTSIGTEAFMSCSSLTEVTISPGVKSIGERAFFSCNLIEVTIPSSVTEIGVGVFANNEKMTSITVEKENKNYLSVDGILFNFNKTTIMQYPPAKSDTSYTIPESVTRLEERCFSFAANLEQVTIGENVETIGNATFSDCSGMTHVTIPKSVKEIGYGPFASCSSLKSIEVEEGNTEYVSVDGVLYNHIMSVLIQYPAGSDKTKFIIPDSVVSIGHLAFYFSNQLSSVFIDGNMHNVGYLCFANCPKLTFVEYNGTEKPDCSTTLGNIDPFSGSPVREVCVPDDIYKAPFSFCYMIAEKCSQPSSSSAQPSSSSAQPSSSSAQPSSSSGQPSSSSAQPSSSSAHPVEPSSSSRSSPKSDIARGMIALGVLLFFVIASIAITVIMIFVKRSKRSGYANI